MIDLSFYLLLFIIQKSVFSVSVIQCQLWFYQFSHSLATCMFETQLNLKLRIPYVSREAQLRLSGYSWNLGYLEIAGFFGYSRNLRKAEMSATWTYAILAQAPLTQTSKTWFSVLVPLSHPIFASSFELVASLPRSRYDFNAWPNCEFTSG